MDRFIPFDFFLEMCKLRVGFVRLMSIKLFKTLKKKKITYSKMSSKLNDSHIAVICKTG